MKPSILRRTDNLDPPLNHPKPSRHASHAALSACAATGSAMEARHAETACCEEFGGAVSGLYANAISRTDARTKSAGSRMKETGISGLYHMTRSGVTGAR
jgi:hypothetical protein